MADDLMFVIGVDDRDLVKAQKEQLKFQKNLITIEQAYRKGDITAKRYNQELNKQAKRLQALGGNYRTASSEVRKFSYQLRQADDAALSQSQAMAFAGKRVNRLGANMQQAGYQIGDFAVQVQGGTNVMVALGQQGAQLLGIFGPAGAIAGAGLAITTAFLAPLMKVKSEAKEAASAAEELDSKLKSLDDTLEDYGDTIRAIQSGVSLDELFASRGVESAVEELERAKTALEGVQLVAGVTAGLSVFAEEIKEIFNAGAASKYEAAVQAVIAAETRLALLREKEADKRASNFAVSSTAMKQELELLEVQAKFGANSAQARNASLEQELRNRKASIDARVEAGELDANAAASLKLQAERAAELRKQIEANTAEQERFTDALKLHYDLQQELVDKQKELKEAVEGIKSTVEAEAKVLEEKLALNEIELEYGKNSLKYQEFIRKSQRNQYKEQLKSKGILGNNLEAVMAIYDANVLIEGSLRRQNETIAASNQGAGYEAVSNELQLRMATGMGFVPDKKDKGKAKTPKAEKDPLAELRKRITLEEELIGKTEAQSQVIQALGVNYQQVYGKAATDQVIDRINKIKELQDEEARLEDTARAIGSAMEDSFTSMIDGTSSVKDAFRNMARDIVAHLFKVLVIQRAIQGIGGALSGSSNAAVADIGGALQSYDGGGYTGSGPRSGGMDGRGGRLAVIHPRETVIDHTKAGSGSGEQIVINQSFNFSANGDDSVKKLIAQAAPQIANLTQKQIMDSRRRGGSMKATFG